MYKNLEELKQNLISSLNTTGEFKFQIKVIANSKVDLIDFNDGFIKIKTTKRALENKANKAIIEFLSEKLDITKSKISIFQGEKSSNKIIKIIK